MTTPEVTNKAYRPDYNSPPFYYLENAPDYSVIIAWSPDAEQMKALMWNLLETFPDQVDILLKSLLPEEHPIDGWYCRYHGHATLATVRDAITQHQRYVFEIGFDVLCLRKDESYEYIALDEYGVLYYYTDSEETFPSFEAAGFANEQHELVSDGPRYMKCNEQADQWRDSFIAQLGLEEVHQEHP